MENTEYQIGGYSVKEVQQRIFEIFLEFDKICKRHHLRYTLEGGTLLGAVLYHDFIPWDDDMDVIMLREDYEAFCKIANQELPQPYLFQNMRMNPEYPYLFGKIYNTETIFKEKKTAHLNIPYGVFLDIFIEDNIHLRQKQLHSRLVSAVGTVKYIKHRVEKMHLRHLLYGPLFLLSISQLNRLADHLMRIHEKEETAYIYPLSESISFKPPLPRRMLNELQPASFHGYDVMIPVCHMWYLHKHYETPMEIPPPEKRYSTHEVIDIKL